MVQVLASGARGWRLMSATIVASLPCTNASRLLQAMTVGSRLSRPARKSRTKAIPATKQPDGQIRFTTPAILSRRRGVGHRRKRGTGSDGREAATDERGYARHSLLAKTGSCVRRNRLGPTPRCWRQVAGRKPVTAMVAIKPVTRTKSYKP